jgi:hypothetical protein
MTGNMPRPGPYLTTKAVFVPSRMDGLSINIDYIHTYLYYALHIKVYRLTNALRSGQCAIVFISRC